MKHRTLFRSFSVLVVLASALLAFAPSVAAQDADGDGVLDANDNCTNAHNDDQVDGDADSAGNVCDCGPQDAMSGSLLGPSMGLSFLDDSNMEWVAPVDTGGGTLAFDLLRSTDPADFTSATCLETDEADTNAADATEPSPSTAFFYVVRAQGNCGGNLGSDRGEIRRFAAACPSGTPLANCSESMDVSCPDSNPACGANFDGGGSCLREFKSNCYDTGLFSYRITPGSPLEITFDDDVNSLTLFFAHEGSASGTMRFFDEDNIQVDSPLTTNGNCLTFMPARQTVSFSRPVRRAKVTATGTVWIDTFEVN